MIDWHAASDHADSIIGQYLAQKAREGEIAALQPSTQPHGVAITLSHDEAAAVRQRLIERAEEYLRDREIDNQRHGMIVATVAARLVLACAQSRYLGVEPGCWINGGEYRHVLAAVAEMPIAARLRDMQAMAARWAS